MRMAFHMGSTVGTPSTAASSATAEGGPARASWLQRRPSAPGRGVVEMEMMVTAAGNLTADPVKRVTAQGAVVVNFRIAAHGRRFDRESAEWRDTDPVFLTVNCWRGLAVNAFAALRKGDGVVVYGRMLQRTYDDRLGVKRTVDEIEAQALGPDLSRHELDIRRKPAPAALPEPAPAEPAASEESQAAA